MQLQGARGLLATASTLTKIFFYQFLGNKSTLVKDPDKENMFILNLIILNLINFLINTKPLLLLLLFSLIL